MKEQGSIGEPLLEHESRRNLSSISRQDLMDLPPIAAEAIRTKEEALQELLRKLAGYSAVAGVGTFPKEKGSHMEIFVHGNPWADETITQLQEVNGVTSEFEDAMDQVNRIKKKRLGFTHITYRGLYNNSFEDAVDYFSVDRPEERVDRERLAELEAQLAEQDEDEVSEDFPSRELFKLRFRQAMDSGSLTGTPHFVKIA